MKFEFGIEHDHIEGQLTIDDAEQGAGHTTGMTPKAGGSTSRSRPPAGPRQPTWQCEFCGRFHSERTAKAHAYCVQEADRRDAESRLP